MPIDPVTGGLIVAAGSLLGQGATAYGQGRMNKKMRKWNEKMYQVQRQDALSDWALQNQYNSPQEQMARLRKAGLNPNLVYGNGATAEGGMVRGNSVDAWKPQAPSFDPGQAAASGIQTYLSTKTNEAQVDNLTAQNAVLKMEAILKAAQTAQTFASTDKTKVDTEKGKLELGIATSLRDVSIQAAEQELKKLQSETDKIQADTKYTLDQNERQQIMQGYNIAQTIEAVLRSQAERSKIAAEKQKIYQEIENLKKTGMLQQLDIDLKEIGIQPSDPAYMRVITRAIQAIRRNQGKEGVEIIKGGISEILK